MKSEMNSVEFIDRKRERVVTFNAYYFTPKPNPCTCKKAFYRVRKEGILYVQCPMAQFINVYDRMVWPCRGCPLFETHQQLFLGAPINVRHLDRMPK